MGQNTALPGKTVIVVCDAMLLHLQAAQEKMGTSFPVVEIDRKLHAEPKRMCQEMKRVLAPLGQVYDTILLAMGFCGGALDGVGADCRIVVPRVDDCITLLLHTDDTWYPNLKSCGHMYFRDNDEYFNIHAIYGRMLEQYGEKKAGRLFRAYFRSYTNADIIDTGTYDCREPGYVADAQAQAEMIHSKLGYVPGSNILLEKLVSGRWDEQFVILEPGETFYNDQFIKQPQGTDCLAM